VEFSEVDKGGASYHSNLKMRAAEKKLKRKKRSEKNRG